MMKEIAERYVDSKMRVLLKILHGESILDFFNISLPIDILEHILINLSKDKLIEVEKQTRDTNEGDQKSILPYEIKVYFEVKILDKSKISQLLNNLLKEYPKREKYIIQERGLKIIAKDIGDMFHATQLISWLKECGIDEDLIIYPNTKWKMVLGILIYLSASQREDDFSHLGKILEDSCHPLFHNGDKIMADTYRVKFNNILEYDGYGIINNKFIKLDDTTKKELDKNQDVAMKNRPQETDTEHRQTPLQIEITKMPEFNIPNLFKEEVSKNINEMSLSKQKIVFDDDKAQLFIGSINCQLPPYRNEHYFCRAIFQHPIKEFIDWSIIYENMEKTLASITKEESKQNKRTVQDTMYSLNKRIKKVVNTEDNLFTWQEKSIKRNY